MIELVQLADELGLTITDQPTRHRSGYYPGDRTIGLSRDMPSRTARSVLAHEIAHHLLGHRPTRSVPARARQERAADEWAALQLISLDDYVEAERLRDGHMQSIAFDLDVSPELVLVYQSLLLRTDASVYVDPRQGTGQWAHRVEVVA